MNPSNSALGSSTSVTLQDVNKWLAEHEKSDGPGNFITYTMQKGVARGRIWVKNQLTALPGDYVAKAYSTFKDDGKRKIYIEFNEYKIARFISEARSEFKWGRLNCDLIGGRSKFNDWLKSVIQIHLQGCKTLNKCEVNMKLLLDAFCHRNGTPQAESILQDLLEGNPIQTAATTAAAAK